MWAPQSVAIEERTAPGLEHDVLGALRLRGRRVLVTLEQLHLSRPCHQREHRGTEADFDDAQSDEWLGHLLPVWRWWRLARF